MVYRNCNVILYGNYSVYCFLSHTTSPGYYLTPGEHVKQAYVNYTRDGVSVTFKRSQNSINPDALAYYNLSSSKLASRNIIYDNYIFGRYQLDAGNKTPEIVKSLNDYCMLKIARSTADNRFTEKLQKAASSQGITLFPIVLIIIMILLNSVSISSNWIENRKTEIFVRRMVGATNHKISMMLLKDFFMIITISYIIAILFA